jgi:hypothetical protein
MSTDRNKKHPLSGADGNGHDAARWLLGALGLLFAGRLALRTLRGGQSRAAVESAGSGAAGAGRSVPRPLRGHENTDANAKGIFIVVLFLLFGGLAVHGIVAGFFDSLKRTRPPKDQWQPQAVAATAAAARLPYPRLQVSPPLDLQSFRAWEEAQLHSYGWVDRSAGVVRIPIERAMDLVLPEGLPTRAGSNGNQVGPSSFQLMQERPNHRESEIKGAW